MEMDKLNNPGWYSLSETHEGFAVDYNDIKFYHPDIVLSAVLQIPLEQKKESAYMPD
jgi:hypothetical protein